MNDFLTRPSEVVASELLGWNLQMVINGQTLIGKIVETEAYSQLDAASHSYRGQTPRTEVMFGPAGHAYVYFTYGMHFCFNVVTGQVGEGSAVLIRALEPLQGEAEMSRLRGGRTGIELTNGPAKLCQALGIDKAFNGHDLSTPPFQLIQPTDNATFKVVTSTRIGISRDTDRLWRFYVQDNPYVSKP